MSMLKLNKGAVIIREGDPSNVMYFLVKGKLEASTEGKVVNTIYPDEVFGELAYVLEIPRTATVTAAEDSVVIVFCPGNFHRDLDDLPEWVQKFLMGMMKKIVNLTKQVAEERRKKAA